MDERCRGYCLPHSDITAPSRTTHNDGIMTRAAFYCEVVWLWLAVAGMLPCVGGLLSGVRCVALSLNGPLAHPHTTRALYARFTNRNPLVVQLWRTTTSSDIYRLDWQVVVQPRSGNGSVEIINLSPRDYMHVQPDHRLAIINARLPGPVTGTQQAGSSVILSVVNPITPLLPLNVSETLLFDNLQLPYHIPVHLCNHTDCPYELPSAERPLPGTDPASSSTESNLLSEQSVIILLVWAGLLTLLLVAVVLALVCICDELDKRKRETSSLERPTRPRFSPKDWYASLRRAWEADSSVTSSIKKPRKGKRRIAPCTWYSGQSQPLSKARNDRSDTLSSDGNGASSVNNDCALPKVA